MSGTTREVYVSVDVETAGPNSHSYALLSIGACLLDMPEAAFYIELQPIQDAAMPDALAITGLSMQCLKEEVDGYPDPYFQEVYLEAESIPIFSKLARHVSSDALDEYVSQLQKEVKKYVTRDLNYGKAAKRMYNIFRLTGRYEEAAFVRELFDEPATLLYQVWSLIRTIDDVIREESNLPMQTVISQADQLILSVIEVLEGEQESEIVRLLLL